MAGLLKKRRDLWTAARFVNAQRAVRSLPEIHSRRLAESPVLWFLLACESSKLPEGAQQFAITVSNDGGYTEKFDYYLDYDASSVTIYINEAAFARGTLSGCDITYQSVVFGQDRPTGAIKWQLFGEASFETAEGDPCVDGDDDWAGTEFAEIVASEDEQIEVGTEYLMTTAGSYVGDVE